MGEQTATVTANPFGCAGCVVTLLIVIAMVSSIATPWGNFSINLFHHPGIYLTKTK